MVYMDAERMAHFLPLNTVGLDLSHPERVQMVWFSSVTGGLQFAALPRIATKHLCSIL